MRAVPEAYQRMMNEVAAKLVTALRSQLRDGFIEPERQGKPWDDIALFDAMMNNIGVSDSRDLRLNAVKQLADAAGADPDLALILFKSQYPMRYGGEPKWTEVKIVIENPTPADLAATVATIKKPSTE